MMARRSQLDQNSLPAGLVRRMDSKGVICPLFWRGFGGLSSLHFGSLLMVPSIEIQRSFGPAVTCPFINIGSSQSRSWVSSWFCWWLFKMVLWEGFIFFHAPRRSDAERENELGTAN